MNYGIVFSDVIDGLNLSYGTIWDYEVYISEGTYLSSDNKSYPKKDGSLDFYINLETVENKLNSWSYWGLILSNYKIDYSSYYGNKNYIYENYFNNDEKNIVTDKDWYLVTENNGYIITLGIRYGLFYSLNKRNRIFNYSLFTGFNYIDLNTKITIDYGECFNESSCGYFTSHGTKKFDQTRTKKFVYGFGVKLNFYEFINENYKIYFVSGEGKLLYKMGKTETSERGIQYEFYSFSNIIHIEYISLVLRF